ncbi:WXG100 family type VII secretion target [Kitasatospora sp. NPDC052868]|uniref:WXG100 family type VII secretion target n=1 Tax=Kitasatospora sp. NPDC052868 TaxID=3364060 RepID=UPI0037C6C87D
MFPLLHLDSVVLEEHQDELTAIAGRLAALLAELDQGLARLDGFWEGEAAYRFQQRFAAWQAGSAELRAALERLRAVVVQAQQHYRTAQEANHRMWGVR